MKRRFLFIYFLCFFILMITPLPADAKEIINSSKISSVFDELKNKNYGEAINKCRKLEKKKKYRDYAFFLEGLAWFWKGENQKAIDYFTRAVQLNSNRGDAFFYRGLAYGNLGNIEQAFNDVNRSFHSSSAPKTEDQIGNVYVKMGWNASRDILKEDVKTGFSEVRAAFGMPPFADTLAAEAHMLYIRSKLYVDKGDYDKALKDITAAIDAWPMKTGNSSYYALSGYLYLALKQLEKASAASRKALDIDPQSLQATKTLGVTEFYQGNYSRAIKFCENAIRMDSSDYVFKIMLGISYWLAGQKKEAVQALENLLSEKEDASLFMSLAYLYHLTDKQEKALEYFQKAVSLDKDRVLNRKKNLMNMIPVSSPTRAFYEDQYAAAELYTSTGKTPAAVERESWEPSLEINALNTTPAEVPVNKPFKINLSFTPDLSYTESEIEVLFSFIISRDGNTLFRSKEIKIQGKNRTMIHYQAKMNAVPRAGAYAISAEVKSGETNDKKSAPLIIK